MGRMLWIGTGAIKLAPAAVFAGFAIFASPKVIDEQTYDRSGLRCNSRLLREKVTGAIPTAAAGRGSVFETPREMPQTILIDMSGRPSILHNSTSPFTTGPTFSGVPE